jgi:hypothetical protein
LLDGLQQPKRSHGRGKSQRVSRLTRKTHFRSSHIHRATRGKGNSSLPSGRNQPVQGSVWPTSIYWTRN